MVVDVCDESWTRFDYEHGGGYLRGLWRKIIVIVMAVFMGETW